MKPAISIIIPTYRRPDYIKRLLASLLKQTIPINQFEILVIDNDSGDNTAEVIGEFSRQYPDTIYYYQQKKRGASATRNLGITKAKSDIILFLDDDMSASPRLVEEHLCTHMKYASKAICVLGFFETEWNQKDDIFLKFLQKSEMQNDFPSETEDEVPFRYFYTGNISCAKSAINLAGGFDEGFTNYGVEDIDLGYRLEFYGTKIYFNKKALCFHNYNPEFDVFLKKREQAGVSLGYFVSKYPHLETYFTFGRFPWFFLGVGRWVLCPLLQIFIHYHKKDHLTLCQYLYFRLRIRWALYKNFFLFLFKKRLVARNSLYGLLR